MADNYLDFSEVLDNLTVKEAAWLDRQLDKDAKAGCPVFLADYPNRDPYDTDCGFAYSFAEYGGRCWLEITSAEGSNVDAVAHLIMKFLRRFRPDQCWSLTYSLTCSKPRAGEFSGGAVFVTADEISGQSSYDFVAQQQEAFQFQHPQGERT